MRCEAKHKWFKKLVFTLGNYKNIPKSLAAKHQDHQAAVFSGTLEKQEKYGPARKVTVCEVSYKNLFTNMKYVVEVNWMYVKGMLIHPHESFVPVGYDEKEDRPEFLFVVNILAWPQTLVCKKVKTFEYDCQVGAYEVEVDEELVKCTVDQIIGHRVVYAHDVLGKKFIASKVCFGGSF
ncbi:E3 ubiquitin-protein ligase UPL4 [Frankliniella fusca]|nr:E3 ubiquitin-protein ligase UPL4 [Frankliniella fusca]